MQAALTFHRELILLVSSCDSAGCRSLRRDCGLSSSSDVGDCPLRSGPGLGYELRDFKQQSPGVLAERLVTTGAGVWAGNDGAPESTVLGFFGNFHRTGPGLHPGGRKMLSFSFFYIFLPLDCLNYVAKS